MKKLVIFLIIVCSLPVTTMASDSTYLTCKYRFAWQTDSTRPNRKTDDIMLLSIKSSSSLYYSYLRQLGRRNLERISAEREKSSTDGIINLGNMQELVASTFQEKESEVIEINFASKSIEVKDKLAAMKPWMYKDVLEVPTWQLQDKTDTILGQFCQAATTFYKGRNYTAWFAPAIPYPMGPWFLNGLPGLILKAEDDKKEIAFECIELNAPEDYIAKYKPFDNPNEITQKKYKELKALFMKDYYTFASEIEGKGFTVTDKNGNPTKPKPKAYNPVDRSN